MKTKITNMCRGRLSGSSQRPLETIALRWMWEILSEGEVKAVQIDLDGEILYSTTKFNLNFI